MGADEGGGEADHVDDGRALHDREWWLRERGGVYRCQGLFLTKKPVDAKVSMVEETLLLLRC